MRRRRSTLPSDPWDIEEPPEEESCIDDDSEVSEFEDSMNREPTDDEMGRVADQFEQGILDPFPDL